MPYNIFVVICSIIESEESYDVDDCVPQLGENIILTPPPVLKKFWLPPLSYWRLYCNGVYKLDTTLQRINGIYILLLFFEKGTMLHFG